MKVKAGKVVHMHLIRYLYARQDRGIVGLPVIIQYVSNI